MVRTFFYIFSLCLLLGNTAFAQQDLQKQLIANKWYVSGSFISSSMTFSQKPIAKAEVWEAKFLANGKMKRCDSIRGSLFDKNGKETKMVLLECDSTGTYQINKDVIHFSKGVNHYYFKPKANSDKGFEFIQAKAEDFNKK